MTVDEAMQAAEEGARADLRGFYPMAARVLAAEVRRLRREAGKVGEAMPLQFAAGAKVPGEQCQCRAGECESKPVGCRMVDEVRRRDPRAM